MKLIEDLGRIYLTEKSTTKSHYGIFECPICKKHIKTRVSDVNNGSTTKCRSCANKNNNVKHSEANSRLYNIRNMMIQRCTNPNATKYDNYGARGITVCNDWIDSYESFRDWALINGYSKELTIDRKENDKGYYPDNCRWVNKSVQSRNTRILSSRNTTGYRGVIIRKSKTGFSYQANIRHGNNKTIHIGTFKTIIEAAKAYDQYIIDNNLEHTRNF